jgi:diguanylate cyclase (GGDEF)-like protein
VAEEYLAKTRAWFFAGLAATLVSVAAVASLSASDPDGWALRFGMILMTIGAALWMPLPALVLVVPGIWLGPTGIRSQAGDHVAFTTASILELPGLLAIAGSMLFVRRQVRLMEEETQRNAFIGLSSELDEATGVYQERLLADSIERELVRSRRFGREFGLMLASVDPLRAKFDYREEQKWDAAIKATAMVLLNTRTHIDRVYLYGDRGFALLLPETGQKDITGLLRRLARAARRAEPPEGEPGGPLPLDFGVTFFPQCATTVEDLLRRAEVAVRIAEKNPNRVQIDGAEAPDLPAPELSRKDEEEEEERQVETLAGQWLGAEAPEEESAGGWVATAPPQSVAEPGGVEALEPAARTVHDQAEAVAAETWQATEGEPESQAATAPARAIVAEQVVIPEGVAPRVDPELAASVSDMLKRMDETLALIRRVKAGPN